MDMEFARVVEYVEKKSRFFGYLLPCEKVEEVENALKILWKEHKKATHICYAYSLKSPFLEKAVDDGEPSSTAGRPILSVIQKKGKSISVELNLARAGLFEPTPKWQVLFWRINDNNGN